jgi:hypothetical protein
LVLLYQNIRRRERVLRRKNKPECDAVPNHTERERLLAFSKRYIPRGLTKGRRVEGETYTVKLSSIAATCGAFIG